MLIKLFCVGAGGFFGCILRFLIGTAALSVFSTSLIPMGTLIANSIGCFVIGFIAAYVDIKQILNPIFTSLIFAGFLGGLTTFSTFSLETLSLLRQGHFTYGVINILIQVMLGLLMVWLGYYLMTKILT